jgi:hypothetical protein
MTESAKSIELSDGGVWTLLDFPPGYWSMTRTGSTRPPIFSREPFTINAEGFTAADHRVIADMKDPPRAPDWRNDPGLKLMATRMYFMSRLHAMNRHLSPDEQEVVFNGADELAMREWGECGEIMLQGFLAWMERGPARVEEKLRVPIEPPHAPQNHNLADEVRK